MKASIRLQLELAFFTWDVGGIKTIGLFLWICLLVVSQVLLKMFVKFEILPKRSNLFAGFR